MVMLVTITWLFTITATLWETMGKEILLFGGTLSSTSGVLLLLLLFYFLAREITRVQTYKNLWAITHGLTIWWKVRKSQEWRISDQEVWRTCIWMHVRMASEWVGILTQKCPVDEVLNNQRNKMRVLRMSINLFPQSPQDSFKGSWIKSPGGTNGSGTCLSLLQDWSSWPQKSKSGQPPGSRLVIIRPLPKWQRPQCLLLKETCGHRHFLHC